MRLAAGLAGIPMGQGAMAAAAGALGAVPLAASIGEFGKNVYDQASGKDWDREVRAQEEAKRAGEARARRMAEYQALMEENVSRLQQYAPDVYNQVLAGRRLPRGAVVIGGSPRTDLLMQLSQEMTNGG